MMLNKTIMPTKILNAFGLSFPSAISRSLINRKTARGIGMGIPKRRIAKINTTHLLGGLDGLISPLGLICTPNTFNKWLSLTILFPGRVWTRLLSRAQAKFFFFYFFEPFGLLFGINLLAIWFEHVTQIRYLSNLCNLVLIKYLTEMFRMHDFLELD